MHGVDAQEVGGSGHRPLIGSCCWSCGCGYGHVSREGELLALGINAVQVRRNSGSRADGRGQGLNEQELTEATEQQVGAESGGSRGGGGN